MFHVKQKLEAYRLLVERYHKTLDLVSTRALIEWKAREYDALAYAETIKSFELKNQELIDIGSGVGIPGLIIAIALPQYRVHLVERRKKRVSFLKIACSQLALQNVYVHEADIQNLKEPRVSLITALAVGTFSHLYCLSRHLHDDDVTLISRKGDAWKEEKESLEELISQNTELIAAKPLTSHGTLVAIRAPGGYACPSLG